MVFHRGEQHDVTRAQVGPAPRVGHQVDGFGGVLGEDDLSGLRGTHETSQGGSRVFNGRRGLFGNVVGAAMDVGVDLLVVPVQGIQHLTGLLGGGRRVQIDDGAPVHLTS